MKRSIIETHLDKWLENINTVADVHILNKAINLKFKQILESRNSSCPKMRQSGNNEFRILKFLQHRIEIVLPVLIEQSIEDQSYRLLPEHEKCNITSYRYMASFHLTANIIPKIKGFHLLEKFGWYNQINNPRGVVKDHRLSILYGFTNNINPDILAHPANCEFLTYQTNCSKSSKNSISLSDLKEEIKKFN